MVKARRDGRARAATLYGPARVLLLTASIVLPLAVCLATAAGAFASGWRVQPAAPGAAGGMLNGVSCISGTACVAVGSSGTQAQHLLAEVWNGSRWSLEAPVEPARATASELRGVSCTYKLRCVAVGSFTDTIGRTFTLAERWDGTRWSIEPTRNRSGFRGNELLGVSCTSARACTAVGDDWVRDGSFTLTLAERWNGSRWSIQATPERGVVAPTLKGVSCWSATACTAVGSAGEGLCSCALVERWGGGVWSVQAADPSYEQDSAEFDGVSCTGATACTAVGVWGASGCSCSLVERFNGSSWSGQDTPDFFIAGGDDAQLNGVACTSASACIAVGFLGSDSALAEGWNGRRWSIQGTPNVSGQLNAVSCASRGFCAAVGARGTGVSSPLIEQRS